ncbi:MAG: hypothetical protein IT306_11545 [Chloroflexi bacterium]|nr:hypothetical protein [Chloroflexota bacterium]
MPAQDRRDAAATTEHAPGEARDTRTRLDAEQIESGGGLRYQQRHRDPAAADDAPPSSVSVEEPSLRQRGEHYGNPGAADREALHEHGYPKLGGKLPSRVTQVEHGPYAGGSQQGDTKQRR